MIAGTGIDASGIVGGYSASRQMTGASIFPFAVFALWRGDLVFGVFRLIGYRGHSDSRVVRGAGGCATAFLKNLKKSRVLLIRSGKAFVRS
ncbi:hypothetical protein [Burkholderia diffusa]|uniref:hypothetical protein n=1 Tax=Burkholderia diffusa TaxID=488732 RepID=UPI0012DB61F5|nr:hypothetical protein [Burkholderia diffusa]